MPCRIQPVRRAKARQRRPTYPASRRDRKAESRFYASLAAVFLMKRAAALFAQILEMHGLKATVEPAGALTTGRVSRLSAGGAQLGCLSYLDADLSTAGARLAVRRLRRQFPEAKI